MTSGASPSPCWLLSVLWGLSPRVARAQGGLRSPRLGTLVGSSLAGAGRGIMPALDYLAAAVIGDNPVLTAALQCVSIAHRRMPGPTTPPVFFDDDFEVSCERLERKYASIQNPCMAGASVLLQTEQMTREGIRSSPSRTLPVN